MDGDANGTGSGSGDEVPRAVVVRVYQAHGDAHAGALVLEALGIPNALLPAEGGGLALAVPEVDSDRALRALGAHEREQLESTADQPVPAPDGGHTLIGFALGLVLIAFFAVTGPREATTTRWFAAGSALAGSIRGGDWWRAVTALTLHADWAHVLGNAAAAAIFVTAVCRWLGRGVGLATVLATGVLGNLATAWITGARHDSVGASTALFGALGLIGGLQSVRKARDRSRAVPMGRMRRAFPVVAACLGLFAMLGVSERADVIAHAAGLLVGFVMGASLSRLPQAGWVMQALLGAAAVGLVAACWWRAFIPAIGGVPV